VHETGGQTHPLEIMWTTIQRKFPQCAPANLETSSLIEIGDFSLKLWLRCSCQFPWCVLVLILRRCICFATVKPLLNDPMNRTKVGLIEAHWWSCSRDPGSFIIKYIYLYFLFLFRPQFFHIAFMDPNTLQPCAYNNNQTTAYRCAPGPLFIGTKQTSPPDIGTICLS
jgi:hypothetical protein